MSINGLNGTNGQNGANPDEPIKYDTKDLKDLTKLQSIFNENQRSASASLRGGDVNGDGKITKEGDLPLIKQLINKFYKFAKEIYNFTLSADGKKAIKKLAKKQYIAERDAEKQYLNLVERCHNFISARLETLQERFEKGEIGATDEQYAKAEVINKKVREAIEQDKTLIESTNPEDLDALKNLVQKYKDMKNGLSIEIDKGNETYQDLINSSFLNVCRVLGMLESHIDSINETLADLEPDDSDANKMRLERAQMTVTSELEAANPNGFLEAITNADMDDDGVLLYCEQNNPELKSAKEAMKRSISILREKVRQKGIGSREREIYSNGLQYLQSILSSYDELCEEPGLPEGMTIEKIYYKNGRRNFESEAFDNKKELYKNILNYFADDKANLTDESYEGFKKYVESHAVFSTDSKGNRVYSNDVSKLNDQRFLTKDDVDYLTRYFQLIPKARRNVSSLIGRPSAQYTAKLDQQRKEKFRADYEMAQQKFAESWSKAVAWYWSGDNRSHDPVADLMVIGYTEEQAESIINGKIVKKDG